MSDTDNDTVVPIDAGRRKRARKDAPYQPPPLPSQPCLVSSHIEHLTTSSGLTAMTCELAKLFTASSRDELIGLLGRVHDVPSAPAIAFPFMLPGRAAPYGYRVRPDEPRLARGSTEDKPRPIKYDQPSGGDVGVMVYFPPRATLRNAWGDSRETLYWTEGEKKALVLDQEGYACVGLTGVWNWADPKARKADKRRDWKLHPLVSEHVHIAGRHHVIVFDQDANTNPQVMQAARRLARALRDSGAERVEFVTPPEYGQAKGVDDYYVSWGADGAEKLREMLRIDAYELASYAEDQAKPIADLECAKGAPIPDGLQIPMGYRVNSEDGAVTRHGAERAALLVSDRPLFIARAYADLMTGEQRADVTWHNARGWRTVNVSRRALMDGRTMVSELCPQGAPVTATNSKHLAEWFLAFETVNDAILVPSRSVARTGWVGDGDERAFMLGTEPLGGAGASAFVAGAELARVGKALRARGSLDEHAAALRRAWAASPIARLIICASAAAPLLEPVGASGFALHLCGDSSRGKTTMLRVAASLYGDPLDGSWVASWNSTANAIELRAGLLCDLPQCYDEAGAGDQESIQRLIYTLANGEGRGRATRDATLRSASSWRTIVLSSGEIPLASESAAVGAQARVLDVILEGWGELEGDNEAIEHIANECAANAGSLGAHWLRALVQLDEHGRASLRALRKNYKRQFVELVERSPLASRLAEQASALMLAEHMLVASYGFDGTESLSVAKTLSAQSEYGGAPRAAAVQAADDLSDWLRSASSQFPRAEQVTTRSFRVLNRGASSTGPRSGIVVCEPETERVIEVLIIPSAFRGWCQDRKRAPRAVLRAWADKGWIRVEHGRQRRFDLERVEHGQPRSRWYVWLGPDAAESSSE